MDYINEGWRLLVWGSIVFIGIIVLSDVVDARNGGLPTQLMKRLRGSRMFAMMRRRTSSVTYYLYQVPGAELRRHLRICAACHETARCDCVLGADKSATDDYSFCPIDAVLDSADRMAGGNYWARYERI